MRRDERDRHGKTRGHFRRGAPASVEFRVATLKVGDGKPASIVRRPTKTRDCQAQVNRHQEVDRSWIRHRKQSGLGAHQPSRYFLQRPAIAPDMWSFVPLGRRWRTSRSTLRDRGFTASGLVFRVARHIRPPSVSLRPRDALISEPPELHFKRILAKTVICSAAQLICAAADFNPLGVLAHSIQFGT